MNSKRLFFLSVWPEQEEETVDLQNDSNDRPADQNHQHSSQEEAGGFYFVPLEEEPERSLQADDEGKARDEQNLHDEKTHSTITRDCLSNEGDVWLSHGVVMVLLIDSRFQWLGELYQKTASSQRRGKTRRTPSAPSQFL